MSSGVDSRRVSRRDVVAEHLLHWAVADRHAAGDGEMTNDAGRRLLMPSVPARPP
jgi:hypothetical protein